MENTKIYNCKYCKYTSNRNFNLKQHEINKHYKEILKNEKEIIKEKEVNYLNKEVNYLNKKVNYFDKEVNYLNKEVNSDNNITEYNCKKCNKKYLTYNSYIKHEEKCNGLDSLTCPKCMFHFTTKQAKSFHIKRNNCKPKSII